MSYIGSKPANKPVVASDLDPAVITGQTALTSSPADTDEFIISDGGVLKRLDASLIGGGGKVLQVVQGTQGLFATTSTSFTSTGLDAAITPSASSSKVLVTVTMVETSNSTANKNVTATLFRGSTNLAPSGSGQHKAMGVNYNAGSGGAVNITFQFLDTPNTTNATTYTVHVAAESGATITMGINSTTSFIQLMEIGA